MKIKHFLSITDLSASQIWDVLVLAKKLKKELKTKGKNQPLLKNKTLAMIFEKQSLRTRVSFEIGMTQLGGNGIYLVPADIAMGTREPVSDVAKVLSSMADLIMARTFSHQVVKELAKNSSVPVINGLSDLEHPCQIMADLLTIWEIKDKLKGLTLAFVGDGENNVTHSLCLAVGLLGFNFHCASPKGYSMKKEIVVKAKKLGQQSGAKIMETTDPVKAVSGADVVYTDTWISMGDESEKEKRLAIFKPYQVTTQLMQLAKKSAIFMHDLPVYRGNEVSAEVIDGEQSVVFKEAENRLHSQKAIMCYLTSGIDS